MDDAGRTDEWYILVHVYQRWRYVVLESPYRLNLQSVPFRRLRCTERRIPNTEWNGDRACAPVMTLNVLSRNSTSVPYA
jgi:hypothetical protein